MPHKKSKYDFNNANDIFVLTQVIVIDCLMPLFSENYVENVMHCKPISP